jgi:ParB-like chromosome segregation protein Spo0J
MDMPFHPLAELFPLIKGAEFDELVESIKENGQLEPISTLDGTILDGRNRYRACQAAGVEPRFEEFTGRDPVRFVFIKNINRRHLTVSQRALIAAEFAQLKHGDFRRTQPSKVEISTLGALSAEEAADIMGVDRATVFAAKRVLSDGTKEEIAAVRNGNASANRIAREINRRDPERATQRNAQALQMRGDIWRRIRDALDNLTSLPLPSEVAAIARIEDRKTKGAAIDGRLAASLQWLTEFSDAWNARHD